MKRILFLCVLFVFTMNCLLAQKQLASSQANYTASPKRPSFSGCGEYYAKAWDIAYKKHMELCARYPNFTTSQIDAFNKEYKQIWHVEYLELCEKAKRLTEECNEKQRKKREAEKQTKQQRQEPQQTKQQVASQAQQQRNNKIEAHNKQIWNYNARISAEQAAERLEAEKIEKERRTNRIVKPAQQNIDNFTESATNAAYASETQGKKLANKSLLAKHNAQSQGRDISVKSQTPSAYAMAMMAGNDKNKESQRPTENVLKTNHIVANPPPGASIAKTITPFHKGNNEISIVNKDVDPVYIYTVSNDPNIPSIQKAKNYSDNEPCIVKFTNFLGDVQILQFENYNQFKIYLDQENKRNQQFKKTRDKTMKNITDDANDLLKHPRAMAANTGIINPSQTITLPQIKMNSYKVMKVPVPQNSSDTPSTSQIIQNPISKPKTSNKAIEKPKKETNVTAENTNSVNEKH